MIRQILKMLFNQRQRYMGIFIEQVMIFIVLMLCFVSVGEAWKQYRQPGMLDTDNTVVLGFMNNGGGGENMPENMRVICENLRKLPYVEAVCQSYNLTPYLRNAESYLSDSIATGDGVKIRSNLIGTDSYAYKTLRPVLTEGRWLTDDRLGDGSESAVVSEQFCEKAGWNEAIGKKIEHGGRRYTIVGVIEGIRHDLFAESPPALIVPVSYFANDPLNRQFMEFCARIRTSGAIDEFGGTYYDEFNRIVSDREIEPLLLDMDGIKKSLMFGVVSKLFLQSVPTAFLFVFAFIGTFGLFWLHSRQRMKEFALRMAVGSTRKKLTGIVVVESLIVTVAAAIPGLVLALFIYDFSSVQLTAIGLAFGVMLLFSAFSSWFPAYRVSRINPAEALHYE